MVDPSQKNHGERMSEPAARAEALLLLEGGPLPLTKLCRLLSAQESELSAALDEIAEVLEGTGLSLVRTETEVCLSSAPRTAGALRSAFEASLSRDIGPAGLEVLAIVLYRGPSSRTRIDYIRGVNTGSTIRVLLSRGLLQRTGNPEDAREYLYRPSAELLASLGARNASELPEYATIHAEFAAFEQVQTSLDTHDGTASNTEDTGSVG